MGGKTQARAVAPIDGKINELFLDAYGNVHAYSKKVIAQLFIYEKSILPLYTFESDYAGNDLKRLRIFDGKDAVFLEKSGESNCHDYIAVDTTSFEVDTLISLYNGISFEDPPSARKYKHPPIPGVGQNIFLRELNLRPYR